MAEAEEHSGRLLITSGGVSGFMWEVSGYPNWGYTQNTVTANEKLARAALQWLTGKGPPYSILYMHSAGIPSAWNRAFREFVTRSDAPSQMYGVPYTYGPFNTTVGLSSTITDGECGTLSSWTNTNWNGNNPFDHDLVLLLGSYANMHNVGHNREEIDYYLNNNGAVWVYQPYGYGHWENYGCILPPWSFPPAVTHQDGGAPDYMIQPVQVPEFGGSPDTYQYGVYSSYYVVYDESQKTVGGTSRAYGNGPVVGDVQGSAFFLWSAQVV